MTRRPLPAPTLSAPIANNLLAALRVSDYGLLHPHLERWKCDTGDTLFEPGDIIRYVYFPCDSALISFRVVLADGRTVETALIGREGAVGGVVSNGRLPAFARATVQQEGAFYRTPLSALDRLKDASSSMGHLFARYADCMMAQIFQSTACNAAHTLEQRFAKWMIATVDRTGSPTLKLTQEELGQVLGVGRSYASRVVARLKADNLIHATRGSIVVDNCDGLQQRACNCDVLVRRHFDTMLAGVYPNGAAELDSD